MKHSRIWWGLFYIVLVLCTVGSIFYVQQRYSSRLQGGGEYQWYVTVERKATWIASDYLTVNFLGTRTTWTGIGEPIPGRSVYITLGQQPNGILYVKTATNEKPKEGVYLIGQIKSFREGTITFSIPFNRYRTNINKIDPTFYSGKYKGVLIATLKLKDGHGVITGIYSKGIPIELATPESDEALKKNPPLLLPSGMMDEKSMNYFVPDHKVTDKPGAVQ